MNHSLRLCLLSVAFSGVLLTACSQQAGAPAPSAAEQKAQADAAAAARNLDTYRQLLKLHDDEMVVAMGKDIVSRFPDSAAAKEVQQSLPAVEKRYTETRETKRLASLWTYQVSPMAGGTQSTATIFSSEPAGNDRVRLVLRRHTSWGQSAYLYGNKPGFVCRGNCTINGTVDGKPVRIKAFAPPTGEPALMIRDDKPFIAMLRKAKTLNLDVTLADGEKKETLVYEVAGFDPGKWLPLPRTGKGKGHK
ncbi:MAG TPA: hypothetical protein VN043_11495 [Rhodanobacter sp.]|nr:hypothetical protein [Rhodanobacter sp.]